MAGRWQVGIDIGGTFTDVVALRPGGGPPITAKVHTRPDDLVASLRAGLRAVGLEWEEVDDLVHGTTAVTNAIVEGRLARVAFVTTQGFADVLAIGRQNRRELYRLDVLPKPAPQVPAEHCFEIRERLAADGTVLTELTPDAAAALAHRVRESGVEAIAVSLLHAYVNPAHEQALAAALRGAAPYVALSHRVNPEAREYERGSTTVLSASVMPLAARYLDRLEAEKPTGTRLHLFHSAGGMTTPDVLRDLPLGLALSGPAAGVAAACRVAAELGIEHAVSFDMGGTTTDVCLISHGQAEIGGDRKLGGRPLRLPTVAVESIGAGGGSIARYDDGILNVGPKSAGADPGPACYGRGGKLPTVCDADLILGYLEDGTPLGGDIRLDREAARRVLSPLGDRIGIGVEEAALGIARVANAAMARAIRRVTVERGVDGRRCSLIAFGGAGPMHAVEVARAFGIARVIVPRLSSAFSALGCLAADMSHTRQQTVHMASVAWDWPRLSAIREDMIARLGDAFGAGPVPPRVAITAAIRYGGQSYAVEVPDPSLDDPGQLGAAFKSVHRQLYGFATDGPWELTGLRVTLSVPRNLGMTAPGSDGAGAGVALGRASCWFDGSGSRPTARYDRAALATGQRIEGPAIVGDEWSTVILPPGASLVCGEAGHLSIEVGERA
jgi:N-methylhydantoinase A